MGKAKRAHKLRYKAKLAPETPDKWAINRASTAKKRRGFTMDFETNGLNDVSCRDRAIRDTDPYR